MLQGGCLCGAIKYTTTAKPFASEYCHCRMCQKIAGSPVTTWMDFKIEQVIWKTRKPKEYQSSEHVRRGFCGLCGSTLSFRDDRNPDYLTLSVVSLDDPNKIKPSYHIYTQSQVDWLKIDDDCKRYPQGQTN
ncbi:MAG: GFA family protein [Proteobacteria bacterium]|nr:GFA family protein [Pseudomonadota bacterium]